MSLVMNNIQHFESLYKSILTMIMPSMNFSGVTSEIPKNRKHGR